MAKFVIAGSSDCPFFARIELLADELQQRLHNFSVHKITLKPEDWNGWIASTCEERGWVYNGKSPIVWRELINRGGKGSLVGSSNEFLEIAKGYYGLTLEKATAELQLIASENTKCKVDIDLQEEKRTTCANSYRITVTDAHTAMAYSLLPHLCTDTLSKNVKDVDLTLFSSDMDVATEDNLSGISMELFDCANCELRNVIVEKDVNNAFVNANVVIILNASNIDEQAVRRLKSYGSALSKVKSTGKIIVAGREPMIACYIISQHAAGVPKENFFALSRLQENHVKSAVAKKLSVNTQDISNVILWGSSLEFILHHSDSVVKHYDGAVWAPHIENFSHSVNEMVYDKQWLANELPKVLVSNYNDDARKTNLSHTAALISQLQQLLSENQSGLFSLGMVSKGWYGIPEGLVFSVPVFCNCGKAIVRQDLLLNDEMKEKIAAVATNLKQYCEELMQG